MVLNELPPNHSQEEKDYQCLNILPLRSINCILKDGNSDIELHIEFWPFAYLSSRRLWKLFPHLAILQFTAYTEDMLYVSSELAAFSQQRFPDKYVSVSLQSAVVWRHAIEFF